MINISVSNKKWDKVLVVFGGKSDIWWLRFLKKGFKHCFVILFDAKNGVGVLIDPLCSRTVIDVSFVTNPDFLKEFFEANDYTVLNTVRKVIDALALNIGNAKNKA